MRVLAEALCSSCSFSTRRPSHGHPTNQTNPEEACHACQCLASDVLVERTSNGVIKVGIEHGIIDNEEKRLDAGEAKETKERLSDADQNEDGMSGGDGDGSVKIKTPKRNPNEEGAIVGDIVSNGSLQGVEDEEHDVVGNNRKNDNAANEKTRSDVPQNPTVGESLEEVRRPDDGVAGTSTSENEDDQVRPHNYIKSSMKRPSDSASYAPRKEVSWAEELVEVHDYMNNQSEDIPTCACVIL